MKEAPKLSFVYRARPPQVSIAHPPLLLLLHTVSGNEGDLLGMADEIDERFLVLSIRAPFAQSPGRNIWFGTERAFGEVITNFPQMEHSREMLVSFIKEACKEFRADPEQVYLLGFGQGAVLALSLVLTAPEMLAGAVAIGGQVVPEIDSLTVPAERLHGFPLMVLHGRSDGTYPVALGRAISSKFSMLPVHLTYREYSMGHFISEECLRGAADWLKDRLDAAGVVGVPAPPDYSSRLAGAQIKVRNLDRSIAFYMRFLGLRLAERVGKGYAFLTNNELHHVLGLRNVGANAPAALADATGMHRLRFELPDQVSFAKAYQTLMQAGIKVTALDRTVYWVLHFEDPDSNGLELFWDARSLPGRPMLWQGRELPLEAEKILAILESPLQIKESLP